MFSAHNFYCVLYKKRKDLCDQELTNVKVSFSVRSTGASMSFSKTHESWLTTKKNNVLLTEPVHEISNDVAL